MAETYDDAVTAFNELHPDVVLVEYRFDALRPYRLIYWLTDRRKQGEPFSIILARVLPLHLFQVDESDIEKTYLAIGADRVFSLEAESQSSGVEEALGRLRNMVARCLPAA